MRACFKCKEIKGREFFSVDRSRRDGLMRWCKACSYASSRKWVKRNQSRYNELVLNHSRKNRDKEKARSALNRAVRTGAVFRKPCAVCDLIDNVEAHHFDYGKPLEVIWLCTKHHGAVHRAMKKLCV